MITNKPDRSHYDLVIIGSGPAGISTALRIAQESSAKIAIIESGSLEYSEKIHQLSKVDAVGDLDAEYFSVHTQRRFGGTSTVWAGFCTVLEKRAFMAGEWPIDYEDISRHYAAAAEILELPNDAYLKPATPIEGSPNIVYKPFYLSPPVRFNEKYAELIKSHPSIDLVLNSTCTQLVKQGQAITEAKIVNSQNPDENRFSIKADQFVLACGGLGNPRMLQLSKIIDPLPVGKRLMDHPHLYGISHIQLDTDRIRKIISDEPRVVHALQLTNNHCLKHDLLSFSAEFNLKHIHDGPLLGRKHKIASTPVNIRAEMASNPKNRASLGHEKNHLRQPISKVEFRFNHNVLIQESWRVFAGELLKCGLGRPATLAPKLKPRGGGHLIGTTRMGHSKADSVVDANCKVHTTNNLYVAGSSVFPAGGAANPTYTIVAMSLRLGEHLTQLVKGVQ